jgi:hypothetical protein
VVAIFDYMSDRDLYNLMVMKGTAEVLRGGVITFMDQTEVVPGDIVRLVVSWKLQVVMIAFICPIPNLMNSACFEAWRCVL